MVLGTGRINGLSSRREFRFEWWISNYHIERPWPNVVGGVDECRRVEEVTLAQIATSQLVQLQAAPDDGWFQRVANCQCQTERGQVDGSWLQFHSVNRLRKDLLQIIGRWLSPVM